MSGVRRLLRLVVGVLAITSAAVAIAGQPCDTTPPDTASMTRALGLAERVQQSLDASGAQVVIIARAGQDLTKYGLNWNAPLPKGGFAVANEVKLTVELELVQA